MFHVAALQLTLSLEEEYTIYHLGIGFGRWLDKSRTEAKLLVSSSPRPLTWKQCSVAKGSARHVMSSWPLGGLNEHCDTSLGSRVMRKSGESAVVILVHLRQTAF
ncbi:hypothetical protein C8J56DRAFT_1056174 [Mycena floridula]|nr:hypothetical protein C8J56DRAFT_1056174 [Mycena floridula]